MSEPFPILTVPTETRRNVEQLGSKQKFWFVHENHNWLFKVARENTGEDWAEKIGSEIGSLLRLQTHYRVGGMERTPRLCCEVFSGREYHGAGSWK